MTAPFDRLRGLLAAGGTSTLANTSKPSVAQGLLAMYKAGGIKAFFQVYYIQVFDQLFLYWIFT